MIKKIFLLLSVILLSSCGFSRGKYHVFSFDNYTIAPGYDDVEFLKLVFDVHGPEIIGASQTVEDVEIYFWDKYFAKVDIVNPKNKEINGNKAIVKKLDYFLVNHEAETYMLNGVVLSDSVEESCKLLEGQYFNNYAPSCVIVKKADGKNIIAELHGDILAIDQDKLSRVLIYVE